LKLTGLSDALRSITVIGWSMLVFGILLYWMDQRAQTTRQLQDLTLRDAWILGLWQALALIPGTSRSGITITAARALGFERVDAARISLLLSMPIILAAAGYAGFGVVQGGQLSLGLDALVAAALAFLTALLAVALMMRWLRHASYTPFVIYRLALGAGLLYWLYA